MSEFLRRIASLAYDALIALAIALAVGVVFIAVRSALVPDAPMRVTGGPRILLQALVLLALAVYFVWCWRRGQTLAMRTWRLRLVDARGGRVSVPRALWRFVLAAAIYGVAVIGGVYVREHDQAPEGWLALVPLLLTLCWPLWDSQRQFLHDRLAGTRLVRA